MGTPQRGQRAPHGLVGRDEDTAELRRLLERHRLVTLAGPVGIGKSRLAATVRAAGAGPAPRVGRPARTARPRGRRIVLVHWRGTRPGAPGALAAAVLDAATGSRRPRPSGAASRRPGPRPGAPAAARPAGRPDVRVLAAHWRDTDVLLVLDDIDPVHTECVGLVQTLLEHVPSLRVLVTARKPLGLGGEAVLRPAPLAVEPAPGRRLAPAVELFLAGARAAGVDAGSVDLGAATDICRALDGLPLAVELAAAQLDRHDATDLAHRLEGHQVWLSIPHAALPRHRSLRDALAAAYVVCDREERIAWGRASILAGAFDESTAVFVCSGGGLDASRAAACLARLAAVGVLTHERDPGGIREPRYRMTAAARDFGRERLAAARESEVAAERRAIHVQRTAAVAESLWSTGSQRQAVLLLQDEAEDLRAALAHAPQQPDRAEAALETLLDLWFWWVVYDARDEGRRHLTHLLPLCRPDSPLTARGMWLAAWLGAAGGPEEAAELLRRAWPPAVLAGDDATVGRIAHVQGLLALYGGDPERAADCFRAAADTIPPSAPGGLSPAVSLAALAVTLAGHAPEAARRTARRALRQPGIRSDAWACLVARYARAFVDHSEGRSSRAWRRARRALAGLDERLPEPDGTAALRQLLADVESGAPSAVHVPAGPHALPPPPLPALAATGTADPART
ncbi:ATP-binding protein [Streptomyces tritici]|uniref:ATP-binding protein n=1 Tax=Streptomyces tritici TaxID=2054410 RepID=UPI003AF0A2CE